MIGLILTAAGGVVYLRKRAATKAAAAAAAATAPVAPGSVSQLGIPDTTTGATAALSAPLTSILQPAPLAPVVLDTLEPQPSIFMAPRSLLYPPYFAGASDGPGTPPTNREES